MSDQYIVELRITLGDDESLRADFVEHMSSGSQETTVRGAAITLDELNLASVALEPVAYGRLLSSMVFATLDLRAALQQARAYADGARLPLHFVLDLDSRADWLQNLFWELLWDDDRDSFLFLNQNIRLVRRVRRRTRSAHPLPSRKSLHAVVAIASPQDSTKYGLPPIDIEAELQPVRRALDTASTTVLTSATSLPTFGQLISAMRDGCDLLYLIAYPRFVEGEPYLCLPDEQNSSRWVSVRELANTIISLSTRPTLIIIPSGIEDAGSAALGSLLVGAGVGAVITGNGLLPIEFIHRTMSGLLRELLRNPDIAGAVSKARTTARDSYDWWKLELFSSHNVPHLYATEGRDEVLGSVEPSPRGAESVGPPERVIEASPPPDSPPPTSGRTGLRRGAYNDESQLGQPDFLEISNVIEALTDLIEARDTVPPLTVGIYGSWGAGKSYVLKAIEHKIGQRHENPNQRPSGAEPVSQVHVVTFNAWEYNANEVIWAGLVRKVMNSVEARLTRGPGGLYVARLRRTITRNLQQRSGQIFAVALIVLLIIAGLFYLTGMNWELFTFAAAAISITGVTKIVYETLTEPLGKWVAQLFQEEEYGKHIGYMSLIQDDLKYLQDKLAQRDSRVLIIIDDLDRCEPAKAVAVLQAIRLLLNFESFIVCLGIDARVITAAVEKHYEDLLDEAGASGYEYLDKIIQIPFQLPRPSAATVRRFLASQMGSSPRVELRQPRRRRSPRQEPPRQGGSQPKAAPAAPTTATPPPAERRTDAAPAASAPVEQGIFSPLELAAFQNLAGFLRPNPRYLKRLLNVYRLVRTLARYVDNKLVYDNPEPTACWLMISAQWPCTAYAMLWHLEQELESQPIDTEEPVFPAGPALSNLYARAHTTLSSQEAWRQLRARIDDDSADLERLIAAMDGKISWGELNALRQYTVHFNPAVESELRLTGPGGSKGAESPDLPA